MMDYREVAEEIFKAGVKSVIPSVLIPSKFFIVEKELFIGDLVYNLNLIKNIYVVGAGKASAAMAVEVEKVLGDRIDAGHVIVKYGYSCRLKYIKVTEAGHPVPDQNSFKAAKYLLNLVSKAGEGDLIICLLSGGGSSLMADAPEGIFPEDIIKINEILVNSGASISEINAVRKHISDIKGGQLSRAAFPSTIVSLILSDVPGDPLEVISSGPTVADSTTFCQALEVIDKYNLRDLVPIRILDYLGKGVSGIISETPKPDDELFRSTHNFIIGSNKIALDNARIRSLDFNINSVIIDTQLQGDVISVADYLVTTALRFRNDKDEIKPVCLLFGGETTVRMTGSGKGGRNQHLALIASTLLKDHTGIIFLSGGTDGNDGPTEAAGAVVDDQTYTTAISKNIIAEDYLNNFDSFHFFKKVGGLVITGPTMTNVMDIIVLIVH
jgi:glycerate-2-kinase